MSLNTETISPHFNQFIVNELNYAGLLIYGEGFDPKYGRMLTLWNDPMLMMYMGIDMEANDVLASR